MARPEFPDSFLNASCFQMSDESKISTPSIQQSKTYPNKELTPKETHPREQERTLIKQISFPSKRVPLPSNRRT